MLALTKNLKRNKLLTSQKWFILFVLTLTSYVTYAQNDVSFLSNNISGLTLKNPTTLDFGPDGRLYVAQQNGLIFVYTIEKTGIAQYNVTNTETITLIQQIPNHNDDGQLNLSEDTRQVIGLLVKGTPTNPVVYVSSSDPRIGGGGTAGDLNLDTNSSMISKLTWNGSAWIKQDLIIGLPRGEENHSVASMQIDEVNNIMYFTIGGNTNAGAPSNNFAFLGEYALSTAVIKVDLGRIETEYGGTYILPTLDDPTRPNTGPNGEDEGDPYGGNDGLNQAKLEENGPLEIFSGGYRHAYDISLTTTPGKEGRIYVIDNGANGGWGGHPENEGFFNGTTNVTNEYNPLEPGSNGPGPNDAKVNNLDNLHLVYAPGMLEPIYGGHPNPIRANPAGAGWFWYDNNTATAHYELNPTIDWPPVPLSMANPIEGDFRNGGVDDGALFTWGASTNGLIEYTSGKYFDGKMQSDLLAVSFDQNLYRIKFTEDGTAVQFVESIASEFGDIPLDVTTQGPGEMFEGTIWVVSYRSNSLTVFEPELQENWQFVEGTNGTSPTIRHENAFVEINDKFYLFGGRTNLPLDIYDAASGIWSEGTPPPIEMHHFQGIEYDGKLYVMGAFTAPYPDEIPITSIYIYDPATDSWSVGSNIPRPRGSAGVVVYNNEIYMIGGITNGHIDGWVSWVDKYNPTTDTWTQLPDAPRARDHFHAALLGDKIYVAGGRQTNLLGDVFGETLAEVDVYDLSSGSWTSLPSTANIITQRAGTTLVNFSNELYLLGGESKNQSTAHNENEVFDPIMQLWRTSTPLNTGRHGTQAFSYQGNIFIAAGSMNQGGGPRLNTMEMFSTASDCTGEYSTLLDEDNDGYSNADEIDNNTNPCNPSSKPKDADGDLISDLNDPDDDNDGFPDTSDLFAIDPDNGTTFNLPIIYPFLNGDPGTGFFGLGFTGIMTNGVDNYEALFDPDNPDLIMGGAVGLASIPATQGDATTNNQDYGFHLGALLEPSAGKVIIKSRIQGDPYFDGIPTIDLSNQSQGIFIGTGDQDNYLKVVLDANGTPGVGANPGIRILGENQGVIFINTFTEVPNILTKGIIDFYFEIDPLAGSAQVYYRTTDMAQKTPLLAPVTLPSAFGPILNGSQALASGLIASAGNGNPYSATWDYMNITSPVPFLTDAPVSYSIPATESSLMIDLSSIFDDDEGDQNLTYAIHSIENNSFIESAIITSPLLTINFLPNTSGSAQITIRATDVEGNFADYIFQLEYLSNAEPLISINSGGSGYSNGLNSWVSDQSFAGGGIYSTGTAIANTEDDILYQTERWGSFSYNIPVPEPGLYSLVLGFAEIYHTTAGSRVFNVSIENGQHTLNNFDIIQEAGAAYTAVTREFDFINVADGNLTITLSAISDNPKISHIQVLAYPGEPGENLPPVISDPGSQLLTEGAYFELQIQASDPNSGDILTYSATGLPASLVMNEETGLISGTIEVNANIFDAVITVTDDNGAFDTQNVQFTIVAETQFSLSLNSGDNTFTFNGTTWETDKQYTIGKTRTFTVSAPIDGTNNDVLYQTDRWWRQNWSYEIPVPNPGDYEIVLHFAENDESTVGARIFDVALEGTKVLEDFDIIAQAGAPNFALVRTFPVTISDGTLNIDLFKKVDNPRISGIQIFSVSGNAPPVIDPIENISVLNNTLVSVPINSTDDGTIILSATGQPSSLIFTDNGNGTGLLEGTVLPADVGTHIITITAVDNDANESTEIFELEILGNLPPQLTFIEDQYLTVGEPYNLVLTATDSPGEPLTITQEGLPAFIQFVDNLDGTATLSGTPAIGDVGISSVTFTVSDNQGATDDQIVAFEVAPNGPPVFSVTGNQEATEHVLFELMITAQDPDSDPISFTAVTKPDFLTFMDNGDGTASLSGTPGSVDIALHSIVISATDNLNPAVEESFSINVLPNSFPVFTPLNNVSVNIGQSLNIPISATDPEGESIVLSIAGAGHSWLSILDNSNGTGELTAAPSSGDEGIFNIDLEATDIHGNTGNTSFQIEILSTPSFSLNINSGGSGFTYLSQQWSGDTYVSGGRSYSDNVSIVNSDNDLLYSSERFGNFTYTIPVPSNGNYQVILHFAEIYFGVSNTGGVGSRLFDVNIENGQGILNDYDIYANAGGALMAITESFNVNVSDNNITISFAGVVNKAKVNGIEIISSGSGIIQSSINSGLATMEFTDNDLSEASETNVYPNPTKGGIIVQTNNHEDFTGVLQIYSSEGKLVYEQQHQYTKGNQDIFLNLKQILPSSGLYYLLIPSENTRQNRYKVILE